MIFAAEAPVVRYAGDVQTFLPYPSFARSARVLDTRRLGKQRVEVFQILRALHLPGYGWQHHPAVRMWRGFTEALVAYGLAVCDEWIRRGHADTLRPQIAAFATRAPPPTQAELARAGALPSWLGDRRLHASHRSALVRKAPGRYWTRFPRADPRQPYFWPSRPGLSSPAGTADLSENRAGDDLK